MRRFVIFSVSWPSLPCSQGHLMCEDDKSVHWFLQIFGLLAFIEQKEKENDNNNNLW